MARYVKAALREAPADEVAKWEIHLVAHSAGSIYATYALPHLLSSGVPLLGMETFVARPRPPADPAEPLPTRPWLDDEIAKLLAPTLVVAGEPEHRGLGPSRSNTHGGFDNDPDILNSILRRILGAKPKREFGPRDLQF